MTMLRYEPWGLNREVWNEFSKFFDRVNNDESTGATAEWLPPVDIEEYADRYVLHADVPGVDPAAIEITLENGVLTLAGSREKLVHAANGRDAEARRTERVSGRFLRRFTLPESVDAEAVKAQGKHGVLEIVIPKRAAAQPRRIAVNH
ncbi:MAG TPA: Hsp20/alpha crystallin family protein [Candidatus Binatia bacterium]|nr:Hsp20/alpha crystallin family protein [Candidatus Binatia bacterium]